MKYCVVVSNAFSFIQTIEQSLRLVLDPWTLKEAVSYAQAEELLGTYPVQVVLVDEATMPTSPGSFFRNNVEQYPATWFVSVGKNQYPGALRLELPIEKQSLGFFMQQTRTPETQHTGTWVREYMGSIYPILLSHLWNGLLNRWVKSDHTMIMMAARRMNMSNLENTHILPILMKTVHNNHVAANFDEATLHHLYFQELLRENVLQDEHAGASLDRFSQKWAVIYYVDMYPVSLDELERRCMQAAEIAEEDNWHLSFYIGSPCLPEELVEQWNKLEEMSEADVGYQSRVTRQATQPHRQIAQLPEMSRWRNMMEQGKCADVQTEISAYIMQLAQDDLLNANWLSRFRDDFLLEVYHALQSHGIPAEKVLAAQLSGEEFSRSVSSAQQLQGWLQAILGNMAEFLETEYPDTLVKKAQKYILQNLDQPLSRDDIAAQVYVSSGYLGRIFKKELNMSLSEYVYTERMKLAAKMLEQSDLYVTSIAMNVGFSNFPYFSTQFKKFTGLTPVEYRKKHREMP